VRFKSVALAAVVALAVHGCAAEPPRELRKGGNTADAGVMPGN
jgi:hypothetical protein